ncbi:hypothetical protein [Planktothricoides sp. SR001]|uniref:hypothetical protein n=1 Tax=Planktothricoides sp. SR001 TaxID=1705388 RepID=UPI0006C86169|nr:hypothetical protein [Planktothricoides sp. SR001]
MNKAIYAVGITILSLTLTGCIKQDNWECTLPTTGELENQASTSVSITPIVQIDGTPSMQGFVNIPDSRYIRTLRLLDMATTTAFSQSQPPRYYRFGINRTRLSKETSTRIAQSPWFYDGSSESFLDARIDKAVEPIDDTPVNEVYIVVTDLYQQEGEMTAVLNSLKTNYLDKEYAVGILGVRSEFDGIVYDVGLTNEYFDYTTTPNKPETFHPFYVMVLGTYENVASYFDRLKQASQSDGLNFSDDQFVIFYHRLVEQPSLLNIESDILESNLAGIERQVTINDGNVMLLVQNERNIERLMFKNTDSAEQWQDIQYEFAHNPLPYVLSVSPDFQLKLGGTFNNDSPDFEDIDQNAVAEFMQASNWNIQENTIDFSMLFNSPKMETGVYKITVDVVPTSITGRNWWPKWNLAEKDKFDGSKTYNVLPFLENLQAITFQKISESPDGKIAKLCYVLHKER